MRVSVVATGIDAEAQGEQGAERDAAVAKVAGPVVARVVAPVVALEADKGAAPEPAPVFVKPVFGKPVSVKPVFVKATNGDVRRGRRPGLAAPDPAERILPNGADRKPPSVTRLPRSLV